MSLKVRKNPDKHTVKDIMRQIKENNGYCPCKLEQTTATKCMCLEFREQNTPGYCHCGLYFKEEVED